MRGKYDSNGAKIFEDENALDVLLELLSNILNDQRLGTVYLMIDALDECDAEIHELLRRIIDKSFKLSAKVKWLTTSRNEPGLVKRLRHQQHISLELNSLDVTRSVATFIDRKIRQLREENSYAIELQDIVRKSLLEKSGGTFLWVALVCKELSKVRQQKVRSVLEQIPAGLTPLYERMLKTVLPQEDLSDVVLSRRLLRSVTLALRPLRIEEIAVFTEIPNIEDIKELTKLYGSFLTIREETVYFVHQSAKDYLSDRERKEIFPLGQEHEHANTTRLCLGVMSRTLKKDLCDIKMPGTYLNEIDNSKIMGHIPCHVQYACLYWFDHLQQASSPEQTALVSCKDCQVYVFLRCHFLHWLEALCFMNEESGAGRLIVLLGSRSSVNKNPRALRTAYADLVYD